MAKVISFINYKGGVGKTTTTFHIGCALAMFHQKRVLLIDADPQTNLTFLCSDFAGWEAREKEHGSLATLYTAYIDNLNKPIRNLIWKSPMSHTDLELIDLVPSTIELLDIDLRLQSKTKAATTIREIAETHLEQRSILQTAIIEVKEDYDYILIDCPPNLYLATQNALYASDGFLVTLMPDHFSTVGVNFLDRKIQQLLRERSLAEQIVNPTIGEPKSLPFYLCFVKVPKTGQNHQKVAQEQMAMVRRNFQNKCFQAITEEYKDIREATTQQLPVFLTESGDQNSEHYKKMTEEFLTKFK